MLTLYIALQTSHRARHICSEYAKFTAFSTSWYRQVARNPSTSPDQIRTDLDDVSRELSKIAEGAVKKGCIVELDVTLQDTDMERFYAAHAKLAREICQDERMRELWYSQEALRRDERMGLWYSWGALRRDL